MDPQLERYLRAVERAAEAELNLQQKVGTNAVELAAGCDHAIGERARGAIGAGVGQAPFFSDTEEGRRLMASLATLIEEKAKARGDARKFFRDNSRARLHLPPAEEDATIEVVHKHEHSGLPEQPTEVKHTHEGATPAEVTVTHQPAEVTVTHEGQTPVTPGTPGQSWLKKWWPALVAGSILATGVGAPTLAWWLSGDKPDPTTGGGDGSLYQAIEDAGGHLPLP